MIGLMACQYFWPGMTDNVKQFVRNRHACGKNTMRRNWRKGLLHPLPVPERVWSEISMDYITELPGTVQGHSVHHGAGLTRGFLRVPGLRTGPPG
jgi:hypothetical protein